MIDLSPANAGMVGIGIGSTRIESSPATSPSPRDRALACRRSDPGGHRRAGLDVMGELTGVLGACTFCERADSPAHAHRATMVTCA